MSEVQSSAYATYALMKYIGEIEDDSLMMGVHDDSWSIQRSGEELLYLGDISSDSFSIYIKEQEDEAIEKETVEGIGRFFRNMEGYEVVQGEGPDDCATKLRIHYDEDTVHGNNLMDEKEEVDYKGPPIEACTLGARENAKVFSENYPRK